MVRGLDSFFGRSRRYGEDVSQLVLVGSRGGRRSISLRAADRGSGVIVHSQGFATIVKANDGGCFAQVAGFGIGGAGLDGSGGKGGVRLSGRRDGIERMPKFAACSCA